MMIEIKAKCALNKKTHLFELHLESTNDCQFHVELTYDQYFSLVQYLGKVALAYQHSLAGKKKKIIKPRAKK